MRASSSRPTSAAPRARRRTSTRSSPSRTGSSELLGQPVALATDVVGDSAKATVAALQDGEIALLENIRFDPRETSKVDAERAELAGELAELADVFVSDGFGVVHRKQASVYDVALVLPHAVGQLVLKEVASLRKATDDPARPYVVVLGGSKVSDKLGVIANLLTKADRLLIGGGMLFTFLAAKGYSVGNSLLEEDQIETVKGYLAQAEEAGVEIVLPTDIVVADEFKADSPAQVVAAPTPSPTARSASTSAPSRARCSRPRSSTPRRSSGTARPACSSSRRSPAARVPSRRRWSTRARTAASRSSAVATPPRPCARSASTRPGSDTSRPVVARASSSSRARRSPASRFWRTER